MARDCVHGSLARSCGVCELEGEVDRLRAERDRLRDGIADVRRVILEHRYSAARVTTVTDALSALLDDQEDTDG